MALIGTTANLGLEKPEDGHLDWGQNIRDNYDKLEARLTKSYAGSPVGNVTPDYAGQRLYDSSNNKVYFANGSTSSDWIKVLDQQDLARNTSDGTGIAELKRSNDFGAYAQKVNAAGGAWEVYTGDDSDRGLHDYIDSAGNLYAQIQGRGLDGAGAGYLRFSQADRYEFQNGGIVVGSGASSNGAGTVTADGEVHALSGVIRDSTSAPYIKLDDNTTSGWFPSIRFLAQGTEKWRIQYRSDNSALAFRDGGGTNRFFMNNDGGFHTLNATGGSYGPDSFNAGELRQNGTKAALVPGSSSNPGLSFNTWRQPSATRPTQVIVYVQGETDGTDSGAIAFRLDEDNDGIGNLSFSLLYVSPDLSSGSFGQSTMAFEVPPGVAYQIENASDPQGSNHIVEIREFGK